MFQDPYSSLDPRMRVGSIIREPLSIQRVGTRQEQQQRVFELLDEVGLPRSAVERYPHEFSGGQRQRIGLARALTLSPKVIVADEPVSALDVSIRAQVLNLMKRLQADHGLTYIVISHDLAVVKYLADRIGVMYLGKLVEMGSADDIYQRAAHPYTAGLLAAIPVPDPEEARARKGAAIKGELPSPVTPPSGCRFRTRCPFAQDLCAEEEPPLRSFGPGHVAACHFPLQGVGAPVRPRAGFLLRFPAPFPAPVWLREIVGGLLYSRTRFGSAVRGVCRWVAVRAREVRRVCAMAQASQPVSAMRSACSTVPWATSPPPTLPRYRRPSRPRHCARWGGRRPGTPPPRPGCWVRSRFRAGVRMTGMARRGPG